MALYKKYRPQSLDEIAGNALVVESLRSAFINQSSNNASLYSGATGTGKTTFARIEAMCSFGAKSYEDLKSQWGFYEICSADMGGVDYIREVKRRICHGFKVKQVVFFDECSGVTQEGQSVLLKTIEDAPDWIHFILCTTDPGKLSGALKGRCTRYHLEPLGIDEMVGLLANIAEKEGKSVAPECLQRIAQLSGGRAREALILLEGILPLSDDMRLERLSQAHLPIAPLPGIAHAKTKHTLGNLGDECQWQQCLRAIKKSTLASAELLKMEFPPIKYYLSPLLHDGSLVMIYAIAGVGKTFLILYIMVLLTRTSCAGRQVGPLTVSESCSVLIVDGEMPPRLLKSRLSMITGPLGEEDPNNPLDIVTADDLWIKHRSRINIAEERWQHAISKHVEQGGYKILVLDNLSSLMPGVSENSKESFDVVNQWLLSLRAIGICVVIVHHANKSGDYRGSSGKIDNLDNVIRLKSLNGPDELCFRVEYQKYRSGKRGEGKSFGLEAVPHPENPDWLLWQEVPCDSVEDTNMRDEAIMVELLAGDNTQKEIAKMFGVSQPTVSNIKKMAVGNGLLTAKGQITDLGKEFLRKYDCGCVE